MPFGGSNDRIAREPTAMNVILESERDHRTLAWLIEQAGEGAVERACASLAGNRKTYPSNLAKVLGLVLPESLSRPSRIQVQAHLVQIRKLLG